MIAGRLAMVAGVGLSCGSDDPDASGRAAYEATCAACHGEELRGTSMGPPFLEAIYAPDHHPDDSFRAAVAQGVPPHHWNFGPMPPQAHISDREIDAIIAYVRARQLEAGITQDPSH